jgi:hypothetical protein
MNPDLFALFRRLAGEITAAHGEPFTVAEQPLEQAGRPMVWAGWAIGPSHHNHGFKIYQDDDAVDLLVYAHSGDVASFKVRCRNLRTVEQTIRPLLQQIFPGLADDTSPGLERLRTALSRHATAWERQRDEHGQDADRFMRDQITVAREMQGKAAAYDRCAAELRALLNGDGRG